LARETLFSKENHSKNRIILFRGFLIAMATTLLHANVDFPFQIESLAITFSVMLGVAWGGVEDSKS